MDFSENFRKLLDHPDKFMYSNQLGALDTKDYKNQRRYKTDTKKNKKSSEVL